MKKVLIIPILIILSVGYLYAQNPKIDSLRLVAKNAIADSIKADAYIEISTEMRFVYPDSSWFYAQKAEEFARKNSYYSRLARVEVLYGTYYWVKGNMDSAISLFKNAYQFYKKDNNNKKLGGVLFNISLGYNSMHKIDSTLFYIELAKKESIKYGDTTTYFSAVGLHSNILRDLGRFEEALEQAFAGLKHAEESNDELLLYYSYSNLGSTYYKTGDYKKALENHKKAVEYAKKGGRGYDESLASSNIGLVYSTLKDFDNAIKYYERSRELNKIYKSPSQFITNCVNIAVLHNDMGEYRKAIPVINEGITEAYAYQMIKYYPNLYLTRAYSYRGLENLKSAERNLDSAINWAHKTGKIKILTDAYAMKSAIDSTFGDFRSALRYKDSSYYYIDSINNAEVRNHINELNTKYETEKKEHENALLKKNNEAKEIQISKQNIIINTSIIVGALVLLLLFVIVISRIRLQKRNKLILQQSKELEQSLEEIKTLSEFKNDMTQMLVHDLKNPLNALLNLPDTMDISERKELLKYAAKKMHLLVVNILDVNKYEKANLPVIPEQFDLNSLWEGIRKQYTFIIQEKSLTVQDNIPANTLMFADKGLVERVLSNVFSNAINHTRTNGEISIAVVLKNENMIRIEISDNGYGIEKSRLVNIFDQYAQGEHKVAFSTGIGLTFCKRAVEAHGGTIAIESEVGKGTTVAFEIPVKQELREKENKTREVILSKEDKKKLKPLYEDLKNVGPNETSKFRKLFLEMEALEIESTEWAEALKMTFYQNNVEGYIELVDQIQQK